MTIRILSVITACLLLATPTAAETFSCTDKNGKFHVADNLMKLPEECQTTTKPHKPSDSGNVIYVPAVPAQKGANQEFKKSVKDAERAQAQKKHQETSLRQRAEIIVSAYRGAVESRKSAIRSKKYGNRDKIKEADVIMERSRNDKTKLLQEVKRAHISTQRRQEIETILSKVN